MAPVLPSGNACFNALDTSSLMTRLQGTALSIEREIISELTVREMRLGSIR